MKYIIKNKIISWGGGSTVKDEADNDLFFVKGAVFTFTKKKTIRDMNKNVLFTVRNKFFHLLLPKVFVCDKDGNKLLMLKKRKLFSFRNDFEILPLGDTGHQFSIDGDIIGRHYSILDHGTAVANVQRNFNLIKDSFWLETADQENAPLLIALVIAIDNYFDKLYGQNT